MEFLEDFKAVNMQTVCLQGAHRASLSDATGQPQTAKLQTGSHEGAPPLPQLLLCAYITGVSATGTC